MPNLYSYFFDAEEECYIFSTSSGIEFRVFFHSRNEEFSELIPNCNFIYELQFFPDRESKNDKKISRTLIDIVKNFFKNDRYNIIFYVCEDLDNKGKARKKLFDKWFYDCNDIQVSKIDLELRTESEKWMFGLIIPEEHIYYDFIIKQSENILSSYSDMK